MQLQTSSVLDFSAGDTPSPGGPTADFTTDVSSGVAPLTVTFTDTSTNTPLTWQWQKSTGGGPYVDFEGTPDVQNPVEDFTEGVWAVKLAVTNAVGFSLKTAANVVTVGGPSLTSATIDATGLVLTLVLDETVTGHAGFTLTATGGAVTATYNSGNGTDTILFDLSRAIASDETVTLDYNPGNVASVATSLPLAGFVEVAVTNDSAVGGDVTDYVARWTSTSGLYTDADATIDATSQRDRVRAWKDTVANALLGLDSSHAGGYVESAAYSGGTAIRFERSIGGVATGLANALLDLGLTQNAYTVVARVVPLDQQTGGVLGMSGTGNIHLHWTQTLSSPYWESYVADGGGLGQIIDWTAHVPVDTGADSGAETVVWRVDASAVKLHTPGADRTYSYTPPSSAMSAGVAVGTRGHIDGLFVGRLDLLEVRVYARVLTDDEATSVSTVMSAIPGPAHRFSVDRPLVVCDGASLGTDFATSILLTWPEQLRRQLDGGSHVLNANIGAATMGSGSYVDLHATLSARAGGILDESWSDLVVVGQSLVNDMLQASATAAQCLQRAKDYAAAVKAINASAKVLFCDDVANKNVDDAGLDAIRTGFNTLLKGLTSGSAVTPLHYLVADPTTDKIDGVIALSEDALLTDYTNTTYFHTDGAHLAAGGHAKVFGYVKPAVLYHGAAADATAPTALSASVDTAGTSLAVLFSEPVSNHAGLTLTPSGGAASLTYASGEGTETLVYTIDRSIASDETLTLAASSSDIADYAGNTVADFSGFSVTNGSTVVAGPGGLLGYVICSEPGKAQAQGKLWQDAGKTTPATADGDLVAVETDPYSGLDLVYDGTAGHRPTLRTDGSGHWWYETAGSQHLKCTVNVTDQVSGGPLTLAWVGRLTNAGFFPVLIDAASVGGGQQLRGNFGTGNAEAVSKGTSATSSSDIVNADTSLVMVSDSADGSITLYRDGSSVATASVAGGRISDFLSVGATSTGRHYGAVAFGRALSGADVTALASYYASLTP